MSGVSGLAEAQRAVLLHLLLASSIVVLLGGVSSLANFTSPFLIPTSHPLKSTVLINPFLIIATHPFESTSSTTTAPTPISSAASPSSTVAHPLLPNPTGSIPEDVIHSYVDKLVEQDVLDNLMTFVEAITINGTTNTSEYTTVLHDVENIVKNTNISTEHSYKIKTLEKVSLAIVDKEDNKSSIMIFRRQADTAIGNKYWYIQVLPGNKIFTKGSHDVAIMFPGIITRTPNIRLTAIIYDEPKTLLRETDTSSKRRLTSAVVNVNAYDKNKEPLKVPYMDMAFKVNEETHSCENYVCSYWDYNVTDKGTWSDMGCEVKEALEGHVGCHCTHTTHFGVLIQETPLELGSGHSLALDIITYSGCVMSLLGVTRIAYVAATNPRWRRDTGHKLVLCLAVNVALMTAMFLPVAIGVANSGLSCVIVGAVLHYLLLASFMWTLISAWLQYRRFVVCIYAPMNHLILKMSLLSWALPILPVAFLLVKDPKLYANYQIKCHERTHCFPRDTYFYVTVAGPIILIIITNTFIYLRIVQTFYGCNRIIQPTKNGSKSTRILVMVVFEFFLLGLPWAFGILSQWHIAFLYLFCMTATQHGFILFIFFVFLKKGGTTMKSEDFVGNRNISQIRLRSNFEQEQTY